MNAPARISVTAHQADASDKEHGVLGGELSANQQSALEEDDYAQSAARRNLVFPESRRGDGWTAQRQRQFLVYMAEGLTVTDSATLVGMSASSAYAFRARAAGAAFAVGWSAAQLLQRNRLADELTSRAFRGQTEFTINDAGERTERHRFDNRLAMAMLTRLDRIAAAETPDRTGDARAARLAAQEWERYLDLIADDAGPARAGLFLALRVTEGESGALAPIAALGRADLYTRARAGVAAEVDIADLDPATRGQWTAEQWARAEAAGLLTLAPPPAEPSEPRPEPAPAPPAEPTPHSSQLSQLPEEPGVWQDERDESWRTNLPPTPGFDGDEWGEHGEEDYHRALDPVELCAVLEDIEADRREVLLGEYARYLRNFGWRHPDDPVQADAEEDAAGEGEDTSPTDSTEPRINST